MNHTPTHFIDLMPTLVDITGAKYPQKYKGEKVYPRQVMYLFPLFKGEVIDREPPLFFDWSNGSVIRTDQWKLVRGGTGWELYKMQTDRTETTNLAREYSDLVDTLKSQWQQWARQVGIRP